MHIVIAFRSFLDCNSLVLSSSYHLEKQPVPIVVLLLGLNC